MPDAMVAERPRERRLPDETLPGMGEEDGDEGGTGDWLVTYTDMVTLLLTFFVLLVALSTFDPPREAPHPEPPSAVALRAAPFALPFPPAAVPAEADGGDAAPGPAKPAPVRGAADVARRVSDLVRGGGLEADVEVIENPGGVTVRMAERILFPSGMAELTPAGKDLVARLAPVLAAAGGTVSVEGHTDDVPIANRRFASNWELSAARALVVLQALTTGGVPAASVRAVAYGEMRPVADNADPAGRPRNRRVELLVQEAGR